jgi:hypothetical protein
MSELQYHAISYSFCRLVPADHDTDSNQSAASEIVRKYLTAIVRLSKKMNGPCSEIVRKKLNAMWTPSILTFFGFSMSVLKPHHFVLASHSGHRINAAIPSVRCMVEIHDQPSFFRPEDSMTSHRPLQRQDALGKRIAISLLVSTPWTSIMARSSFFRTLREGSFAPQYLCGFAV